MLRLFFLICLSAFLMTGCAEKKEGEPPKTEVAQESGGDDLEEAPEEMLSSFSVSGYSKGGKRQWDLEGTSADIGTEEINLMDVTGKVYGKETNMTIVADKGRLNRVDNSVRLEKDVLASSDDGATLKTDYLDWDADNRKLSSDAPVSIKRGTMEADGKGMIAQPELKSVKLKEMVTVRILPEKQSNKAEETNEMGMRDTEMKPPASPIIITCDGPLEVDYQNNIAVFKDNVKVEDERGEIYADRMDLYFSSDSGSGENQQALEGIGVEKVVCIGNAEIHHGENVTYSEKAVYDAATGKLTLTGRPKLVIYSTEGFGQMMGAATKTGEKE